MAPIRLLSEEVIGKIAAGEVVERPSAAIKELIENSLDAGATAITVEIRDGGISYFRVTDNGCGIRQNEIRLAFERHATSKIISAKDLETIGTLGFRGEALASIAAVGKVTLTTRTKDDPSGLRVQNNGGKIEKIEEISCPQGTTIIVRDLFFNTPVRLRFLKKPVTEAGFVTELLLHMILSRPDVSFRLINNERTVYHSVGDGQLSSAVHSVYGSQAMKSMRYVDGCASGVIVKGYIGIGDLGRGNRSQECFFINGRMMKSNLLSFAVENACRERVMIGKYPTCALHLTMPYDSVDVNVHPNKLEVRFRDEAAVSSAVTMIVSEALIERDALLKPVEMKLVHEENDRLIPPEQKTDLTDSAGKTSAHNQTPRITVNSTEKLPDASPVVPDSAVPLPSSGIMKESTDREKSNDFRNARSEADSANVSKLFERPVLPQPVAGICDRVSKPVSQTEVSKKIDQTEINPKEGLGYQPVSVQAEQVGSFIKETPKPLKILGALFNTFILLEYEDQLLLIDQHAVHERLLFDRMMQLYDQGNAGQEMLVPTVISVTKRELELIEENSDMLNRLGLCIEPFGLTEAAIRTVPLILGQAQAVDFVREALAELENGRLPGFEKRRAAILQMACKHAVKGGNALTEDELRSLVESMVDRHVTPTCPHGRPLVVSISHMELDKKFKRIQ